jgi:ribosome-binding protein aMBF1 (putative translation factor)
MTAAFALAALPVETNTTASPSAQDRDYLKQIGLRVRVPRTAQRLRQDQLADRAVLDRTYVSRLERGQDNLTVLTIARLAHALNIKELLP